MTRRAIASRSGCAAMRGNASRQGGAAQGGGQRARRRRRRCRCESPWSACAVTASVIRGAPTRAAVRHVRSRQDARRRYGEHARHEHRHGRRAGLHGHACPHPRPPPLRAARRRHRPGRRARRARRLPQPRRRLRLGAGGRPALAREPARRRAARVRGLRRDRARHGAAGRRRSATGSTRVTLPDGGLPMALPMAITAGSGPWWAGADATSPRCRSPASSPRGPGGPPSTTPRSPTTRGSRAPPLHARRDRRLEAPPGGYVLAFCIQFLDAVHERPPRGRRPPRARLGEFVPADGHVPVHGGEEDETLRPLDLAPDPDAPGSRALLDPAVSRPTSTASRPASRRTAAGPSTSSRAPRRASSTGAATRPSRRSTCCASNGRS